MPKINRTRRRWIASAIWLGGIIVFAVLGWWNYITCKHEAETRLAQEAGHFAAQLASLISLPYIEMDAISTNAIVAAAMEDERVYAIRVEGGNGLVEGQRRNYLWEPVPWDDEIAENCVQGMNPLRYGVETLGKVEVWLSPRVVEEDNSILAMREWLRFGCASLVWSAAFLFFFWQAGDLRRLVMSLRSQKTSDASYDGAEKILQEINPHPQPRKNADAPVDPASGRIYQKNHPEAWFVTAGMFHQTFARGPELITRLYAEGETAGLCHLGRILEQAAPCVGAPRLEAAARQMRDALNDPECQGQALRVEECANALSQALDALCGDGQWRTRTSRPGR